MAFSNMEGNTARVGNRKCWQRWDEMKWVETLNSVVEEVLSKQIIMVRDLRLVNELC